MTEGSPFDPSPPFAPVHLVGRQPQQEALRRCLDAARAGTGSLALIAGEAGIGKTALVDWITDVARRGGMLALTGRCYDLSQTPPYGPWREALANLPAFAAEGDPFHVDPEDTTAAGQERFFARVHETVQAAAAAHPAVLVLEDMQWSDPASLDLLRMLGRRIHDLPVLLIVTYRADELTRRHPLHQLLPLLVREARAARIDVPPLPPDAIEALVASRYALPPADAARLVEHLLARGGGNPFYVGEVLRTLASEGNLRRVDGTWQLGELDAGSVPPLVRQTIERRLETLDPDTRRLLEIAATIGEEAPHDLWQAVAGADRARILPAIAQARETALIADRADEPCLRFRHALIRETLYRGQDPSQRQAAHRRIAETLAERSGVASAVAAHFAHANDPRAVEWLVRAGEEALALYAADDAIAALTRAQELAARASQALPPAAYQTRAAAYRLAGRFDRARRDLEHVLTQSRAAGEPARVWQSLLDLGMLWAERDYERTDDYYRAALAAAREMDDPAKVAYSLNRIANWHINRDEPDVALPLHHEALAIFEAQGNRRGVADTLDFLGVAHYLRAELPASTSCCERALPLLRELGDRQRVSSCLVTLTFSGGDINCLAAPLYREAGYWIRSGEEGLAIARAIGWPAGETHARFALSTTSCARGDLGRALAEAEAALAVAEQIDHLQWIVAAHHALGAVWGELLDAERAAAALEAGLTAARRSGSRFWMRTLAATLASLQVHAGESARAAATLGSVPAPTAVPASLSQRQYRFAQAELALARGEPEEALVIVAELGGDDPAAPAEARMPQLLKLRGDARWRLGRETEAERDFREAAESAALFGFQPLLWRIEAARANLLSASGRADEAGGGWLRRARRRRSDGGDYR